MKTSDRLLEVIAALEDIHAELAAENNEVALSVRTAISDLLWMWKDLTRYE